MKTFFAITLLFFTLPLWLEAAIRVEVKAGRETINAIEGALVLPAGTAVERITTGNSAVLIWITPPAWDPENRTVSFAGFSPGGFSGTQPLFTLEVSSGAVTASGGRLFGYRNDGEGTQVVLEYGFSPETTEEDVAPPEPFRPIISSSPDLFGGERFLSFTTQDKGTGVIRYEYASSFLFPPAADAWREVESPFELSSSSDLFKRIRIRAVDGAGNVRVSSVAGSYHYATLGFGIIIILCVLRFLRRSFR